jgi:hypothetical protein
VVLGTAGLLVLCFDEATVRRAGGFAPELAAVFEAARGALPAAVLDGAPGVFPAAVFFAATLDELVFFCTVAVSAASMANTIIATATVPDKRLRIP